MTISPQKRQEILDALRRGTVPNHSLDAFAVGLDHFEATLDEELRNVSAGGSVFKAVRGEYGCGKTFFARWLADRARKAGFATSEVQISETETPLHRLETVYRRFMERLATADMPQGALRNIVDGWFFALEEDVLAEGSISANEEERLFGKTNELLEQRLAKVTRTAPMFSTALRGYRQARAEGNQVIADGILAWLAGQPNVAAHAKRYAGVKGEIDHLVTSMLRKEVLWSDRGILWLGRKGEATYGRRNFLELFSVFTSPPLFSVRYGHQELGFVDEMTFLDKQDGPRILLLGGRAWLVNHIDWQRRVAYVEASSAKGRSQWKGEVPDLAFRLCQAVKKVLATNDDRACWSNRARQQIEELRNEFAWLDHDGTVICRSENGGTKWWTFAGVRANATLAYELSQETRTRVTYDSFAVTFEPHLSADAVEQALLKLRTGDVSKMRPAVNEQAISGLKFAECLPHDLAARVLESRLRDPAAVENTLRQPKRFIVGR
jgi:BREX system ATP-binding protein BrxC/D